MDYTILGRTGLKVSVAGLGCGGPSRLGLRQKKSEKEAVALVRQAIDLGVNFFDTAEWYGTEQIVGAAIAETPRDRLVISTKKTLPPVDHPDPGGEVSKSVEESLKRLRTDYIDIYHVHGVYPGEYPYVKEQMCRLFGKCGSRGRSAPWALRNDSRPTRLTKFYSRHSGTIAGMSL
jgi:aryl-alcohol dehydrogenase-like predicted oxidoreductase